MADPNIILKEQTVRPVLEPGETVEFVTGGATTRWLVFPLVGVFFERYLILTDLNIYLCRRNLKGRGVKGYLSAIDAVGLEVLVKQKRGSVRLDLTGHRLKVGDGPAFSVNAVPRVKDIAKRLVEAANQGLNGGPDAH